MSENQSIEVDSAFLKSFFELADMQIPAEVSQEKMKQALESIKTKITTALTLTSSNAPAAPGINMSSSGTAPASAPTPVVASGGSKQLKTVLVVDDLGIVTVQLEALLKKVGFDVTVSKELFDAIEKYKAQDFGYAIVDLFIPTEREGFILIDEIKKLSLLCKLNTKIIVMSASNKKEHKEKSLNRGADHFVEKASGWQKIITDICLGVTE